MEWGTIIAVYAALLATGELVWRVVSEHRKEETRLEVAVSFGIGPKRGSFLEPVPDEFAIVNLRNHGPHSVRVESVGFFTQDDSGDTMPITDPVPWSAQLPTFVGPRDGTSVAVEIDALRETGRFNPYRPVVAFARTSTGLLVRSRPHTFFVRERTA